MLQSRSASAESREARIFEWYARYAWPIHRMFAKNILSKRCVRCTISEKASPLDEKGVCKYCRMSPDKKEAVSDIDRERMEKELDTILSRTRGNGRYDALVLFSGGKDSTYLVHLLKERYPSLRLLAFTFDNGFLSETALYNIKSMIRKLNIDHMVSRPKHAFCEKVFGNALKMLKGRGCAGFVDPIDGDMIFDSARHYAAQAKIPLILIGLSADQLAQYEDWHSFESDPTFEHSKREKARAYAIRDLCDEADLAFWWDPTRYAKEDIARVMYPYVVWRFDEDFLKNELVRLGYLDEKSVSPLATNYELIPLENVVDIRTLGYSSWEPEFTRMIRSGRADKKFWRNVFELVEYAAKTDRFLSKSIEESLKRLGLGKKDIGV